STEPLLVGLAAEESGRSCRTRNAAGSESDGQADSGHYSEVMDPAAAVVGSGGHAESVLPRQAEARGCLEDSQSATGGEPGKREALAEALVREPTGTDLLRDLRRSRIRQRIWVGLAAVQVLYLFWGLLTGLFHAYILRS